MTAFLSSLISGILLFLSFPKFDLWPLAWAALVPLLTILPEASRKQSFWYGWLTGFVYFLGCVYWITGTMMVYGHLPFLVSLLIMFLLILYLGLYVGLFGYLYKRTLESHPGLIQILAVPAVWTTLEWLRGHLLTGFPWVLLGYSQYQVLPIIQVADLTGVYGVSYVIVLVNVALSQILRASLILHHQGSSMRQIWAPFLLGTIVIGLTLTYGSLRLSTLSNLPSHHSLRVGLIQGNIDQAQKWDPAYQEETIGIYKDLTRRALSSASGQVHEPNLRQPIPGHLDLVVWPETATPFFFELEASYQEDLKEFVQDQRVHLLFGSLAIGPPMQDEDRSPQDATPVLFNSAYLLSFTGTPVARYDKIHLVPFGEYVPLSSLLFFVHKMVEGIGDFGSGREFTVMQADETRLGVVICFEVIFPELVRQFVKNGAGLIATLTNDAWFGRSSAPYQHFSMAVFRAVENRVPVVRAANTGITGSIDAIGRIRGTTPLFTRTYLVQEVILKDIQSVYTQYGDLFAYLCGIITVAILARSGWKKRSDSNA